MNESMSYHNYASGDISAIDASLESMTALANATSQFKNSEDKICSDDDEADASYDLSYSSVVPQDLQDAFDGFTDIFQNAMENSIRVASRRVPIDHSLPFLIYKLYEAMMKDAFNDVIKLYNDYVPPDDEENQHKFDYSINPFIFETASISVTREFDDANRTSSGTSVKSEVVCEGSHKGEEFDSNRVNNIHVINKKRRTFVPKETREFLERVFSLKRSPNSKERKIIAQKCGLSPLQVRVWFTNKRVRNK